MITIISIIKIGEDVQITLDVDGIKKVMPPISYIAYISDKDWVFKYFKSLIEKPKEEIDKDLWGKEVTATGVKP